MHEHGEITSLIARLAWMIDHEEYDTFHNYWTQDAVLSYTNASGETAEFAGVETIIAVSRSSYREGSKCFHVVASPVIDLQGDIATVKYYTLHLLHGSMARPCGLGEYEAIVRRGGDGKWQMQRMKQIQHLAYQKIGASA